MLRLFLVFLFALFPSLSFAQISQQNAIMQQDRFMRDQQKKFEQEKRQREFEAIKKERERLKERKKEENKRDQISTQPCVNLQRVVVEAKTEKPTQKIFQGLIGQCITKNQFGKAIDLLNDYYHKQGYVTTQVTVPKQNIYSGIIRLKAQEGRVGDIVINDADAKKGDGLWSNISAKMQEITAFGFMRGKRLNVHDIDQGIYQMNRLASNKSVMKIAPGDQVGESIVVVNKQRLGKRNYRLNAGYSNLGNDFTGVRTANMGVNIDNALSLNENINLSYATNVDDSSSEKENKIFSAALSIPFGYYTFGFDYSKSDFLGLQDHNGNELKVTGFSDRNVVLIDRLLFSNNKTRINVSSSLTSKKTASYLNYSKNAASERKLVIADIASAIAYHPNDNTNIYLKPSYSKGLKAFNATKDNAMADKDLAKAQFELYKLYASFSKRITVKIPFTLTHELSAQLSKHSLFGSEQISVGGYYSVRGYRENFIIGDSGYYLRNSLNTNLAHLIPNAVTKKLGERASYLQQFNITPFFDYGSVANRANNNSGRLSGYGITTYFNHKALSASLTYSKSGNRSQLLDAAQKEKRLIYFEVKALL